MAAGRAQLGAACVFKKVTHASYLLNPASCTLTWCLQAPEVTAKKSIAPENGLEGQWLQHEHGGVTITLSKTIKDGVTSEVCFTVQNIHADFDKPEHIYLAAPEKVKGQPGVENAMMDAAQVKPAADSESVTALLVRHMHEHQKQARRN